MVLLEGKTIANDDKSLFSLSFVANGKTTLRFKPPYRAYNSISAIG